MNKIRCAIKLRVMPLQAWPITHLITYSRTHPCLLRGRQLLVHLLLHTHQPVKWLQASKVCALEFFVHLHQNDEYINNAIPTHRKEAPEIVYCILSPQTPLLHQWYQPWYPISSFSHSCLWNLSHAVHYAWNLLILLYKTTTLFTFKSPLKNLLAQCNVQVVSL